MKRPLPLLASLFLIGTLYAQTDSVKVKQKFSFEKLRNKRYITSDEIGALIGISGHATNKMFFSYHTVNAWQFERHVYFGPGMGFEVSGKNGVLLNEGNSSASFMIPFFGELRASFLSKKVSPFFSQKTGYSFYVAHPHPSSTVIGGVMFQTQVGIKAFIFPKSSFNFSIGYRLQGLAIPNVYAAQYSEFAPLTPNQSSGKTSEYYNFFVFQAGFTY